MSNLPNFPTSDEVIAGWERQKREALLRGAKPGYLFEPYGEQAYFVPADECKVLAVFRLPWAED